MTKADFTWPPAFLVDSNMAKLDRILQAPPAGRRHDRETLWRWLATVHGELLLIHPFRDGNGRVSRWLNDLLLIQRGYPPMAYGLAGSGSKERRRAYLSGVRRAYVCEYEPLVDFFRDALARSATG